MPIDKIVGENTKMAKWRKSCKQDNHRMKIFQNLIPGYFSLMRVEKRTIKTKKIILNLVVLTVCSFSAKLVFTKSNSSYCQLSTLLTKENAFSRKISLKSWKQILVELWTSHYFSMCLQTLSTAHRLPQKGRTKDAVIASPTHLCFSWFLFLFSVVYICLSKPFTTNIFFYYSIIIFYVKFVFWIISVLTSCDFTRNTSITWFEFNKIRLKMRSFQ